MLVYGRSTAAPHVRKIKKVVEVHSFRFSIHAIPNAANRHTPKRHLYPRSLLRSRGLNSAQPKTTTFATPPKALPQSVRSQHRLAQSFEGCTPYPHDVIPLETCSAERTNQPPYLPLINPCLRIPRHHRTQPRMNLLGPRGRSNLRNVPRRNPTPRHNNHSRPRAPHQLLDPPDNLRRLRCPSRSQDSRSPRRHNILQRHKQIRALVNRPM